VRISDGIEGPSQCEEMKFSALSGVNLSGHWHLPKHGENGYCILSLCIVGYLSKAFYSKVEKECSRGTTLVR
jgi:hypothetical protein